MIKRRRAHDKEEGFNIFINRILIENTMSCRGKREEGKECFSFEDVDYTALCFADQIIPHDRYRAFTVYGLCC